MIKTTFIALFFATLPCGINAQTSSAAQQNATSQERHQNYIQLNRQIYARHDDPGSEKLNSPNEKVKATSQQLHKMITEEIATVLSGPAASESGIINAIATLQGEQSLAHWDPGATNTPFAKLLSLSGNQTAAVAYVIMQGGDGTPDTHPYLDFYDKFSGNLERKASAPTLSDFEGCTFSVAQMKSPILTEAWFLVWGVGFGNSQGSLYLRLYAFDGSNVRTIWKRGPVIAGQVTVTPDSLALDYRDEKTPTGLAHEVLQITSNGLE
jgi:hypothetical protein